MGEANEASVPTTAAKQDDDNGEVFVVSCYEEGYPAVRGVFATLEGAKRAVEDEAREIWGDDYDGMGFFWRRGGDEWGEGDTLCCGDPVADEDEAHFLVQQVPMVRS